MLWWLNHSAFCQASLMNYLIKEICALCKLRSQGMLGPVYPEISSEGLGGNIGNKCQEKNNSRQVINRGRQGQEQHVRSSQVMVMTSCLDYTRSQKSRF